MKTKAILIVVATMALAGCVSNSAIQSKYNAQQDDCRSLAARATTAAQDGSGAEANAGLRFSECMNKSGWRVSMPKPQTAGGPTIAPPSGAPSTNPGASPTFVPSQPTAQPAAVAPVPAQQAAIPPSGPVIAPPSGAPSTSPSAAAARYQPARPTTVQSVPYGTGGGRNF